MRNCPIGESLLWYECNCGHRERIYNEADADCPTVIECPSCGTPTLQQSSFHLDQHVPKYEPNLGQRVFSTLDAESAESAAKAQIKSKHGTTRGRHKAIEALSANLLKIGSVLRINGYQIKEADDEQEGA